MKVYILADYGEDGPENIKATLLPENLPRLLVEMQYDDPETLHALKEKIKKPDPDNTDLMPGWGGPQLHIVELQ